MSTNASIGLNESESAQHKNTSDLPLTVFFNRINESWDPPLVIALARPEQRYSFPRVCGAVHFTTHALVDYSRNMFSRAGGDRPSNRNFEGSDRIGAECKPVWLTNAQNSGILGVQCFHDRLGTRVSSPIPQRIRSCHLLLLFHPSRGQYRYSVLE